MNETDTGASVTGWSLPEAPNTRPASRLINCSRLKSDSGCCASAAPEAARRRIRTNAEARVCGFTCSTSTELLSRRLGSFVDTRSENEQLRAELEPGLPGNVQVELETHLAVLHEHLRDTPLLREVVHVADRQDGCAFHCRHDDRNLSQGDPRCVQEVARPQLAVELDLRHADASTLEETTLHGSIESVPDGIVSEHARGERRCRRQGVLRPPGELGEAVDECRLQRWLRHVLRT